MTNLQTPEIYWLTLTILLTALLWVPYILQLIVQLGPVQAIWDPTGAHPHDAPWALRAKRAHYNAVENLAVFAPLVILAVLLEQTTAATAAAAMIYFFVRAGHFVIHVFAVPVVRTLAFIAGFACQMVFASAVIGGL